MWMFWGRFNWQKLRVRLLLLLRLRYRLVLLSLLLVLALLLGVLLVLGLMLLLLAKIFPRDQVREHDVVVRVPSCLCPEYVEHHNESQCLRGGISRAPGTSRRSRRSCSASGLFR